MKNTNEIQRQIEKKAKDELHGIVEEFVDKIKKYKHNTYKIATFPTHSDRSGKAEINFGGANPSVMIERALIRMVDAAYLEKLVTKKTNELLTKLELL
jgi:hypothetical protein